MAEFGPSSDGKRAARMKMPRMTETERAVFAACFALELDKRTSHDNSAAEEALDAALWSVQCFRKALRDREEDPSS